MLFNPSHSLLSTSFFIIIWYKEDHAILEEDINVPTHADERMVLEGNLDLIS